MSIIIFIIISSISYAQENTSLEFTTKRFLNLGDVEHGKIFKQEFKCINNSSKAVVFIDSYKSCTCTDVEISKEVLKPNEEGAIILTIDTTGKNGYTIFNAGITTNEGENYVLKITANVEKKQ